MRLFLFLPQVLLPAFSFSFTGIPPLSALVLVLVTASAVIYCMRSFLADMDIPLNQVGEGRVGGLMDGWFEDSEDTVLILRSVHDMNVNGRTCGGLNSQRCLGATLCSIIVI